MAKFLLVLRLLSSLLVFGCFFAIFLLLPLSHLFLIWPVVLFHSSSVPFHSVHFLSCFLWSLIFTLLSQFINWVKSLISDGKHFLKYSLGINQMILFRQLPPKNYTPMSVSPAASCKEVSKYTPKPYVGNFYKMCPNLMKYISK